MPFLRSRKSRAALLVAVLGLAVAFALLPFATGLLGTAVLYVMCAPAHRALSRRIPPRAAAVVVLAAALLLILLPGAVVLGMVVGEAPGAVEALQGSSLVRRLAEMRVGGMDVGAQLAEAGGTMVSWVSQQVLALAGSAARVLLSLVIAFFGLYYLLLSPGKVWEAVRDYIPFSDTRAEALRLRFHNVTEATLVGIALTALAQGTLVGIGFWAAGLSSPGFWGTITALLSVLPMLGSALVWGPGVVTLLLGGQYAGAAVLAAFGLVAANVDNVIRLIVYRKVSDIHPMATLVGAFAGLKYFGLLGVLLGPLAIAYFFELLKMYREEYGSAASRAEASEVEAGAGEGELLLAPAGD